MPVAIYPATFDPIHLGHADIARRAARLFDRVVVGVYDRPNKKLMFSAEERVALARVTLADVPNIDVVVYSGLTVDFARAHGATVIVRGLRMPTDFEWEHQLAQTNQKLAPEVETVCLMTSPECGFISSTIARDVAMLGGPLEDLVPTAVISPLRRRAAEINGSPEPSITPMAHLDT